MGDGTLSTPEAGAPQRPGRYPEYRDSGIEWQGEIPAHWEIKRLKYVARISAGQSPPSSAVRQSKDGIPFLQGNAEFGDVHPMPRQSCDTPPRTASLGDILLSVRAPVGALNVADQEYGIGRGLCAITPGMSLNDSFACLMLAAIRFRLHAVATGSTYEAVTTGDIGDLPIPLPPTDEQEAIADILGREAAKIDALVAKQQESIRLLQEKRSALISHAVTKGLDPGVAMRDSGVEWLGEIPAHWEVRPLRHLASKFGSGVTPRGGAAVYRAHGIPFLRSQNVHFDGIRMDSVARISPELHAALAGTHVRSGDVLLNITGASIGRVCAVPDGFETANVNQHVCIIRPQPARSLSQFLAAFLGTPGMQTGIMLEQSGAARDGLTLASIRRFPVPLPPFAEQRSIMDHLDRETAKVDALVAKITESIKLLREYRTALISAAVTGQIDVRHALQTGDAPNPATAEPAS